MTSGMLFCLRMPSCGSRLAIYSVICLQCYLPGMVRSLQAQQHVAWLHQFLGTLSQGFLSQGKLHPAGKAHVKLLVFEKFQNQQYKVVQSPVSGVWLDMQPKSLDLTVALLAQKGSPWLLALVAHPQRYSNLQTGWLLPSQSRWSFCPQNYRKQPRHRVLACQLFALLSDPHFGLYAHSASVLMVSLWRKAFWLLWKMLSRSDTFVFWDKHLTDFIFAQGADPLHMKLKGR